MMIEMDLQSKDDSLHDFLRAIFLEGRKVYATGVLDRNGMLANEHRLLV